MKMPREIFAGSDHVWCESYECCHGQRYTRTDLVAPLVEALRFEIKSARAVASLIEDRNKGGQLDQITHDMRIRAFRLEKALAAFEQETKE